MAAPTVTREQVLAHRVVAHGFDRSANGPDDLAIADLGVQDSPSGTAALSLAARLRPSRAAIPDDWVLVWGTRGAPHYHRRGDLQALAKALWPIDGADAAAEAAKKQQGGVR